MTDAVAPFTIGRPQPRPTPVVGVPLVAGARLPLAFIAFGLLALLAGVIGVSIQPSLLFLPHIHPHVVALAHLWLPGFLLSVSMGAMYQLMPVVLGAPLTAGQAALWIHFGLHVAGTSTLVAGFMLGRFEVVATGGTLVSIGAMMLSCAAFRTFAHATTRDARAWSFPLATAWLLLTAVAGVLLALNRRWPILPVSPLGLLRMHAHLGLAGFFLTLLQGATFQLVPMFTMGDLRRPRLVKLSLALTQIGLPALAVGLAVGLELVTKLGGSVLLAGVLGSGVALRATLRTRRKRRLEPGLQAFVIGAVLLGLTALMGAVLMYFVEEDASGRAAQSYGIIVIAGAFSLMVLGMLCKIVPFLVWMRTYGPHVGRRSVPAATSLASPRLQRIWLVLHLAGLAAVVSGFWIRSGVTMSAGAWLIAGGVLMLLADFVRIARHIFAPQVQSTSTS